MPVWRAWRHLHAKISSSESEAVYSSPTHLIISFRARERLCGVVWPLLQLISKYTGLQCLTLLGAEAPANPTDNFKISVVNYGETTGDIPHDFRSFNGPGFNGVLGVFAQFVAAVAGV